MAAPPFSRAIGCTHLSLGLAAAIALNKDLPCLSSGLLELLQEDTRRSLGARELAPDIGSRGCERRLVRNARVPVKVMATVVTSTGGNREHQEAGDAYLLQVDPSHYVKQRRGLCSP